MAKSSTSATSAQRLSGNFQTLRYKIQSFLLVMQVQRVTGDFTAELVPFLLMIHYVIAGPSSGAQRREAVPVQLMQKEFHSTRPPSETSPGPHRGEASRMSGTLQILLT